MGSTQYDDGKIFVGGLSQSTTKESLRKHFSKLGTLTDCIVMVDAGTSRSRGFGFVTFKDVEVLDAVLAEPQVIDGKEVDCKRACPRETINSSRGVCPASNARTEKIFVGGLPDLSAEDFKAHFAKFGTVVDAVLMQEKQTGRPRGFGFVTFDNSNAVESVMKKYNEHFLNGKWVEVKRAHPKDSMQRGGGGGRVEGGGNWQGMAAGGGEYDAYRQQQMQYGGVTGYDRRASPVAGGGGVGGYCQPGYDMYAAPQSQYGGAYGTEQMRQQQPRTTAAYPTDPYTSRGNNPIAPYSDPYQAAGGSASASYVPAATGYPPNMYDTKSYAATCPAYTNGGYGASGAVAYSNGASSAPAAASSDPYNGYSGGAYSQYGPQRGGIRTTTATRAYPY